MYGQYDGDSDSVFTDEDVSLNLSNVTQTNCNSLNSSAVRRLTYHQTENFAQAHKRTGSIGGSIAEMGNRNANPYGGARPKVRDPGYNHLRLNQSSGLSQSIQSQTLNNRNRVFSDPELSTLSQYSHMNPNGGNKLPSNGNLDEHNDLYVNQCQLESDMNSSTHRYEDFPDNIYCNVEPCTTPSFGHSPIKNSIHQRQNSNLSSNTLTKENPKMLALSQQSLNRLGQSSELLNQYKHGFSSVQSSPLRGATVQDYPLNYSGNGSLSSSTRSLSRKKPVPTPRTILNVKSSTEQVNMENEENQKAEIQLMEINKRDTSNKPNAIDTPSAISELDKIILRYSQIVIDPNHPDDYCPVCVRHLDEAAPLSDDCSDDILGYIEEKDVRSVVCLVNCQHKVHISCLKKATINNQKIGVSKVGYICCPTCKSICGHLEGDMPSKGATMTYRIIAKGLPGYEDYHTIQITYNFPDNCALQGPEHPKPGKPLLFVGFPKTAFLPDTEKGNNGYMNW